MRDEELRAAVIADPNNAHAFTVLADLLTEQGDPRGELIRLQQSGNAEEAAQYLKRHEGVLLGPLAPHQRTQDDSDGYSSLRTAAQASRWKETRREAFLWRNGFIHRVRLSANIHCREPITQSVAEILDLVLAHRSGQFVVEFAFQSNGDPTEGDLQDIIELLSRRAPETTQKITLGDNVDQISWHTVGNVEPLWRVTSLREFEMESGSFTLGDIVAPALKRAVIVTGGLTRANGASIAEAAIPAIEHLEVYVGDPEYGGDCTLDLAPLLQRTDLTQLRTLGLENAMFTDDLVRMLVAAPILKTVTSLNLSQGTLTDEGARILVASKGALERITDLDVSQSFLTPDGIELLSELGAEVDVSDQEEPWDDDGTPGYFVNIAE